MIANSKKIKLRQLALIAVASCLAFAALREKVHSRVLRTQSQETLQAEEDSTQLTPSETAVSVAPPEVAVAPEPPPLISPVEPIEESAPAAVEPPPSEDSIRRVAELKHRPSAPSLEKIARRAYVDDATRVSFENDTLTIIKTLGGDTVAKFRGAHFWIPETAGRFALSAVRFDKLGNRSAPAKPILITVFDRPQKPNDDASPIIEPKVVAEIEPEIEPRSQPTLEAERAEIPAPQPRDVAAETRNEPASPIQVQEPQSPQQPATQRSIASVSSPELQEMANENVTLRSQAEVGPRDERKNDRYDSSLVSLNGFAWMLQSSQQSNAQIQPAQLAGIGIRALHWWRNLGLEGLLRLQASQLNSSANGTSAQDFDLRAHYRFSTQFLFGLARRLQVSFFTGVDSYRNQSPYFTNKFDLLLVGATLTFPLMDRLSSGGEFVFGQGIDGSQKEEIAGFFNYFFTHRWSQEFGYRLQLFSAGSTASAAFGVLPYREALTEGYTNLTYHF